MLLKNLKELIPVKLKKPFYLLKGYIQRGKVIYEVKTPYSLAQVIDKKGIRYLVFKDPTKPLYLQQPEAVYQSYMKLNNPYRTNIPFSDYFHLAWIFNDSLKSILMIGLGGGTTPKRFLFDYPEITFKTVEIDPEVVKIAHEYFYLPKNNFRHQVITGDGRRYISASNSSFDLILLDAFFSRTIPHHLFTVEFFKEVKNRLTKDGLMAINFNGSFTGSSSHLFRSLYKTMANNFARIYLFGSKKDTPDQMQNIILFGLKEDIDLTPAEIMQKAEKLSKDKVTVPGFSKRASDLYTGEIIVTDVPVLTDASPPTKGELSLY